MRGQTYRRVQATTGNRASLETQMHIEQYGTVFLVVVTFMRKGEQRNLPHCLVQRRGEQLHVAYDSCWQVRLGPI